MPSPMANLSFGSQQDSGCKKFKIIASSMGSLRKDARIAGIPTQTAMRATPADESAALLYGVVSVALAGLRRLPAASPLLRGRHRRLRLSTQFLTSGECQLSFPESRPNR